ncbi:DMT family transporter [Sulfitobacter guttiformis]|uniref:S-adenosylmethionine uptake transporter n=1 Tax=Sulfitobacter guttiformis TaxID=74349 RepID=A0A420DQP0_9RHOB|nr:DMT family transporter [Sulfitobacter guttiformis]KIN73802.1 Integral membrane protein [Sulfitobacter guttiformis KCTC 32187]RKE96437.1 S-adenosylmethionine uptake transporter [Sulfitobacter guttiformis]
MTTTSNRAGTAIAFVLFGVLCISLNDMLIKQLSDGYPLHQIIFFRSVIGLLVTLVFLHFEGGLPALRTDTPVLHILRGVLVVIANMSYFLALAVLPLADATALFFVAPLFITLLSIPLLGEKVGPLRLGAVFVGFVGVIIMQRPWASSDSLDVSRIVLLLPVLAALTYALNQLMTRKLGVKAPASTLAIYIQVTFLVVSVTFFLVAGDGRFAANTTNASLQFLLRPWVWPAPDDKLVFLGMGVNGALIGYSLSQAYRLADAATVAPFEYIGLPLAVFWGLWVFGDLPTWEVWTGIILILASGLFVFFRERVKSKRVTPRPVARRH